MFGYHNSRRSTNLGRNGISVFGSIVPGIVCEFLCRLGANQILHFPDRRTEFFNKVTIRNLHDCRLNSCDAGCAVSLQRSGNGNLVGLLKEGEMEISGVWQGHFLSVFYV